MANPVKRSPQAPPRSTSAQASQGSGEPARKASESQAETDPDGVADPALESTLDVTLLADELERYRSFIRLSDAAIWCFEFDPGIPTDLDTEQAFDRAMKCGRMVECNDNLARMYGYESASELMGTPLRTFIALNPQNVNYLQSFWEQGLQLIDGESAETHKDGTTRSFLNNLIGIVDEDGRLTQVWGTQRDITERKQLEARLLEAQRMEAVGQLAGGIAHDFNNMLMVIVGNLGVVLEQSPLDAEDEDALQEALRAADRATELTRQLLTFSRRTLVRRESVSIQAAIQNVFRMLRRVVHESIRFEFDIEEAVPPVFADLGEIEQVLVNLVVNARDAMPNGGVLRLSLAAESAEDGADWVVLRVADTGMGMNEQTRARIFEPFFTSKERTSGTGLGLSVVYGIVKRCSGSVEVQSEAGKGTEFVVRIPASRAGAPKAIPEVAPLEVEPTRSARVLLLEDRRDVLLLVRRFLEASGHRVISAEHPAAAFELVESQSEPIDILLCDVVMPGTNGAEFAKALLRRSPQTKVILMSGYADVPELTQHKAWGARFMTKPFSRSDLDDQIRQALADSDASGS